MCPEGEEESKDLVPLPSQHLCNITGLQVLVSPSIKWAWYSLPGPPLRNVTGLRRDQCEDTPQSAWGEWPWSSHFWSGVRGTSFPPYLCPLRISSLETQWLKGGWRPEKIHFMCQPSQALVLLFGLGCCCEVTLQMRLTSTTSWL